MLSHFIAKYDMLKKPWTGHAANCGLAPTIDYLPSPHGIPGSRHVLAAVDGNIGASDKRRFIRCQIRDQAGDFFRFA